AGAWRGRLCWNGSYRRPCVVCAPAHAGMNPGPCRPWQRDSRCRAMIPVGGAGRVAGEQFGGGAADERGVHLVYVEGLADASEQRNREASAEVFAELLEAVEQGRLGKSRVGEGQPERLQAAEDAV